ncbi:MAG: hypothetical protein IPL61_15015 [Myxococcales bacterium]|nr:hypothetical protein [Myxococcales bacterium]
MGTFILAQSGRRRGPTFIAGLVATALAAALVIPHLGRSAPAPAPARDLGTRHACGRVAVNPTPPTDDEACRTALAARAAWRLRQVEARAQGFAGELEQAPDWAPAVNHCLAQRTR